MIWLAAIVNAIGDAGPPGTRCHPEHDIPEPSRAV